MSVSALLPLRFSQRRTFGLADPRQQLRLALSVLGITGVFLALATWNSYSAFAPLLSSAVVAAPDVWGADLIVQTRYYVIVSCALVIGYSLAVVGVSIAFVHQMASPMVALCRHARALKAGRYDSRVTLRDGGGFHADLARHLNELAAALKDEREKQRAA